MKNWIKSVALATFAALASPGAIAATYYLSDCQAGATAGCVVGSDAANGTTPSTPKRNVAALPALLAGDTVSFARGGSWSFPSPWYPGFGTKTAPKTYNSFQAAWCTSGTCLTQKPLLNAAVNIGLVAFTNGGSSSHKEGVVLKDLELKAGAGSTDLFSAAVFIYNDSDYITLDNLDISGFGLGISIQGTNEVGPGSDGINNNITIRNSNIHDNLNLGLQGAATDLLIENNRFDNNGKGAGCSNRCHNLYLALYPMVNERIVVRGNTLTRSGRATTATCNGSSLEGHGNLRDLIIENNTIDESTGASGGCYGIQLTTLSIAYPNEVMANIVIRGNRVVNVGGVGIGLAGCTSCVVENNVIVWDDSATHVGIHLPNGPQGDDGVQEKVTVRNNSIYFAKADSTSRGIHLDTYGANHKVISNLIYFGPASAAGRVCFQTGPLTMYDAFDNNLCYHAGPGGKWSPTYGTLAAAQTAGYDTHGISADPLFLAMPNAVNGYGLSLRPDSPAVNIGHRTLSAPTDITGRARGTGPDVGAWQIGPSAVNLVPPAAPTGVIVQ